MCHRCICPVGDQCQHGANRLSLTLMRVLPEQLRKTDMEQSAGQRVSSVRMLEGVYERLIRMKLATTSAAKLGLLLHWLALMPTRLGRSTFKPTCPELNLKLLCNLVILLERCGSCDAHWTNMTSSVQRSEFFPSRGDAPELEIAVWNHYALNGVGFGSSVLGSAIDHVDLPSGGSLRIKMSNEVELPWLWYRKYVG
eukprot:s33_g32.t1